MLWVIVVSGHLSGLWVVFEVSDKRSKEDLLSQYSKAVESQFLLGQFDKQINFIRIPVLPAHQPNRDLYNNCFFIVY